jgi:hypothetical protein
LAQIKEQKMIRAGDTIENPITGERVTFLKTSAETDGKSVLALPPPRGYTQSRTGGERESYLPLPRVRGSAGRGHAFNWAAGGCLVHSD